MTGVAVSPAVVAPFIEDFLLSPDDPTPLLILADVLDENGDERGERIRRLLGLWDMGQEHQWDGQPHRGKFDMRDCLIRADKWLNWVWPCLCIRWLVLPNNIRLRDVFTPPFDKTLPVAELFLLGLISKECLKDWRQQLSRPKVESEQGLCRSKASVADYLLFMFESDADWQSIWAISMSLSVAVSVARIHNHQITIHRFEEDCWQWVCSLGRQLLKEAQS